LLLSSSILPGIWGAAGFVVAASVDVFLMLLLIKVAAGMLLLALMPLMLFILLWWLLRVPRSARGL